MPKPIPNSSEILNLPCGKKWDRTPYFCWNMQGALLNSGLINDKVILRRMEDVYSKFRTYMDVTPDSKRPSVAYFSMEYGLNHVLKIYSGGLGVLAGDYLKEASDT